MCYCGRCQYYDLNVHCCISRRLIFDTELHVLDACIRFGSMNIIFKNVDFWIFRSNMVFHLLETENMSMLHGFMRFIRYKDLSMARTFLIAKCCVWRMCITFKSCANTQHTFVNNGTHIANITIEKSFELWTLQNTWNATLKSPINPDNRHSLPAQFEICLLCLLFSLHLICSWRFLLSIQIFFFSSLPAWMSDTNKYCHQEKFLIDLLSDLGTSMQFINDQHAFNDAHQLLFDEQIIIIPA